MKIVVIGINHAGTSALRTLLKQSKEHTVLAIDQSDNISFLGCGIALSVSSVVKDIHDLFYANVEELEAMGASVLMKHKVTAIDHENKTITVTDLNNLDSETNTFIEHYDKLIYAAGSWPKDHHLKNAHLENIQICKTYEHAQKIIKKANDDAIKNVAIIGAGYIGLELAEALASKNKKVHIFDIRDRAAFNYFDDDFCFKIEDALTAHGIKLYLDTIVSGFDHEDGSLAVSHLITSQGMIKIDYVINVAGFAPNTSLLKTALKNLEGAIIVDEYMRSSINDIYVIGDAAAIYNAASRKFENIALATNAVKGGIVAASHINGLNAIKLKSAVGTNALHLYDLNLTSTGLNEVRCKRLGIEYEVVDWTDNDRPEFMEAYNKVSIRLIYEKNSYRLLGSQIYSNAKKETHMEAIFFLALAIQKNMTIFEIATADVYFLPHYNKPFNFILGAILKALKLTYIKENN
ncbi:MAG: FAD-dependent oxidoreductase [Mycoplasmoidaceae bacterium]